MYFTEPDAVMTDKRLFLTGSQQFVYRLLPLACPGPPGLSSPACWCTVDRGGQKSIEVDRGGQR